VGSFIPEWWGDIKPECGDVAQEPDLKPPFADSGNASGSRWPAQAFGYKLMEDILPPEWQPHFMHYLAELGRRHERSCPDPHPSKSGSTTSVVPHTSPMRRPISPAAGPLRSLDRSGVVSSASGIGSPVKARCSGVAGGLMDSTAGRTQVRADQCRTDTAARQKGPAGLTSGVGRSVGTARTTEKL
jgi:hypothetical protein